MLFSELVKDSPEFPSKWDFYDQNLTNLNLFPYHSKAFSISKKLSNEQFEYLKTKFEIILQFIQKHKPRLYLFNGKPWEVLLINYKIVKNYEKIQVNKIFSMYFFKLEGTPSVLFDKFFPKHFWLDNHQRKYIIPKMIKDFYNRGFF